MTFGDSLDYLGEVSRRMPDTAGLSLEFSTIFTVYYYIVLVYWTYNFV